MTQPPPPAPATRLALPALLLANIALACGPWLVRLARSASEIGPVAAGFWRLALALPVLVLVAVRAERRQPRSSSPMLMIALGGIAFAADLGAWHVGILHTRLANATLLGNTTALLFPIYGFLIARAWPKARQWAALLLAAAGAVLLLGRSYELSANNLFGDCACILAGFCYTAYLVALQRSQGRVAPATTLAVSAAAGAPLLLAAAAALGEPIWPRGWAPLLLLTLGSQLVGQGLILFAVSRVTPLVVGVMLLVQPMVASAIGWIVYGERLGRADLAGAVAIGAAVLLVRERAPRDLPEIGTGLSSPA